MSQGTAPFLGALDQGTTSTRFIVFDATGRPQGTQQIEHRQITPQPGWVEHDAVEILRNSCAAIEGGLRAAGLAAADLVGIGITNQRETVVVWDRATGVPFGHAVVWQDARTASALAGLTPREHDVRGMTGLPLATYFSASKIAWILDHVPGARRAAERGDAAIGTMDAWLVWNLTGGPDGGRHVTDVTNASRTQLMNLAALDWDDELLRLFRVPRAALPRVCGSCDASAYGHTSANGPLGREMPIGGVLGDQHAALLGQLCVTRGDTKNTYGTGNFLLMHTGTTPAWSHAGLLTTVGHQLPKAAPSFALEGSVAVTGSAVQWLRDGLGLIPDAAAIEPLAASVPDTGDLYFVPAFSGLFAPHWRPDARGVLVGLSRSHTKAHVARATLEAIAFQTRDVVDAMVADSHAPLPQLKVDGGATANALLMQLQADILGVPIVRPTVRETTALGAAYAAGLALGVWPDAEALRTQWQADRQWEPRWSADERDARHHRWRQAVTRSLGWATA